MIVLLPADREGALAAMEQQLSSGEILAELKILERQDVQVWLPKFEMTEELDLGSTLKAMGMPLAFSDEADFSGMAPDADLQISKALHKAFVEVDEKGTEAAAATAIVIGLTSMPMQPEEPEVFRADRPFIFLIQHKESGAILFVGRVMDPH
jgi:serpin B